MRTLWEITQTVMLSAMLFAAINLATTRILVQSVSMQPTLYESDRVLVNKLAYIIGTADPKGCHRFQPTGIEYRRALYQTHHWLARRRSADHKRTGICQ